MRLTRQILHKSILKGPDYRPNVITFYHNGFFEWNYLGRQKANFHLIRKREIDNRFSLPDNMMEFNINDLDTRYDFIICTNKFENYNEAVQLGTIFSIPVVLWEHSFRGNIAKERAVLYKAQYKADKYVFDHEAIAGDWFYSIDDVIVQRPLLPIAETEIVDSSKKDGVLLYVSHLDYRSRELMISSLAKELPDLRITIADESLDALQLANLMANHEYFVDFFNSPEIPWEILLAIQHDCVIITDSVYASSVIKNNYTGIIIPSKTGAVSGVIKNGNYSYTKLKKALEVNRKQISSLNYNNWNRIIDKIV